MRRFLHLSDCTAAAAFALSAAQLAPSVAFAQTQPVSGATTGPGVSVPTSAPGGPGTPGTSGSGVSGASASAATGPGQGVSGEAVLGAESSRALPQTLPRTGGFPLPDPALTSAVGAALAGAGVYLRTRRGRSTR